MTENELIELFSNNLRKYRKDKKLTQQDLAEKTNIADKTMSSIETGRQWCSSESLVAIANALEVEPYELLLPQNKSLNYDSRKTKELMRRLRKNLDDTVSTIENFLTIDRK